LLHTIHGGRLIILEKNEFTIDEAVRKANLKMLSYYDDLEKKVKRHLPRKYIIYIAERLTQCRRDLKEFTKTPPHNLLHSIEANCAYHKDGYDEPLSWNRFAKIMNLYHDYGDSPFLTYTIKENPERFFLMMARQQFELQNTPSKSYMARVWSLFVNNPYTALLREESKKKFGISMEQWFHLAFLSWAAANQQDNCMFRKDIFLSCDFYNVTQDVIETFYRYTSLSIGQIKENYLSVRKQEERAFHFLIRSVFLARPIIDLEDGNMIAPYPNLIFINSGEGLLELVSSIKNYDVDISKSFEAYVEQLLKCLDNKIQIISSNELEAVVKRTTRGKSCDFLVETDTEIILVECKATTFTAKMFTDNAILNNNSTSKIAKALVQLYTTAYDLSKGVFDALNIDKNKPTIGIVVTLGEIPLVNSEWYFNSFIIARADNKLTFPIFPSIAMKSEPISMSVDSFEKLITVLNNSKTNIMDLYEQKERKGYGTVGDWNSYLRSQLKAGYKLLSIIQANEEQFFESMGVDVEKLVGN